MPSGALSSVHYGYEKYFNSDAGAAVDWAGAYKTASSTMIYTFGHGVKISNLERANNTENIWGLGSRSSTVNLEKQFTGSFSVDCILSNPDVFTHVMGAGLVIGDAGGASTATSVDAFAGDYSFTVSSATGIAVGDVLRLDRTSTNYEYVQVSGVSGTTISVFSPLVFDYDAFDVVTEYTDIAAAGVYKHIYKEMDTLPSIHIKNAIDLSTDQQWLLKGCLNTNCTISAAINEAATLKLDYNYMDEVRSATTFTEQTIETYDVYSFAHGGLSLPNGTLLANIQNVEIGLNQNSEVIYGLGSRTGSTGLGKNREYSISASMYFLDAADLMTYAYDGSASGTSPGTISDTTLKFIFNNGQTGTSQRTIQFDFGKVKIDTETLNQAVDAPIVEDVSFKTRAGQITAITNAATIPYIWV